MDLFWIFLWGILGLVPPAIFAWFGLTPRFKTRAERQTRTFFSLVIEPILILPVYYAIFLLILTSYFPRIWFEPFVRVHPKIVSAARNIESVQNASVRGLLGIGGAPLTSVRCLEDERATLERYSTNLVAFSSELRIIKDRLVPILAQSRERASVSASREAISGSLLSVKRKFGYSAIQPEYTCDPARMEEARKAIGIVGAATKRVWLRSKAAPANEIGNEIEEVLLSIDLAQTTIRNLVVKSNQDRLRLLTVAYYRNLPWRRWWCGFRIRQVLPSQWCAGFDEEEGIRL